MSSAVLLAPRQNRRTEDRPLGGPDVAAPQPGRERPRQDDDGNRVRGAARGALSADVDHRGAVAGANMG
jgi:hypothetical protein